MKTHSLIIETSAVGIAAILSGCASLGVAVVPTIISGAHLVGGAAVEAGKKVDEHLHPKPVPPMNPIEQELRSLMPAGTHQATTGAVAEPSTPLSNDITFEIGGNLAERTEWSGNSVSLFIKITGDISPSNARQLANGVRHIAWRRADAIYLRIYGTADGTEPKVANVAAMLDDLILTPRGGAKLVDCEFNPYEDVRIKLGPLIPRNASHRTGIWGQQLGGGWRLDHGLKLEAWGDFSSASAQALINASKSNFPELAVTVYCDDSRECSGWKNIATYYPPPLPAARHRSVRLTQPIAINSNLPRPNLWCSPLLPRPTTASAHGR